MGAIVSEKMKQAIAMLESGECQTAYQAAQKVGVVKSAVYQSRLYKEWKSKNGQNGKA